MALIYIVEDDRNISEIESYALKNAGYETKEFYCAKDFYEGLKEQIPDLFLLDIMLPGMDGCDVCRRLKDQPVTEAIPELMLTARGEDVDRILGLELGADDYIAKPFSIREVLARVRSVLRRAAQPAAEEKAVAFEGLRMDLTR